MATDTGNTNLSERLQADLKAAMLARDTFRTNTLRYLKSAILSVEVAEGKRGSGLTDQEITAIFTKEAKKRQESIALYRQANDETRAGKEADELAIIQEYLPRQLEEPEVAALVDAAVQEVGSATQKDMGRIIGLVRGKAAGAADGAMIARLVKARIEQEQAA
jgi:uncharacterized protein